MRILQGLLLSLGVHFLLVWGSQFLPSAVVSKRERIDFEIVETATSPSPQQAGQVVRQSLLPDGYKVSRSEDPLTFLSEESQRVRKQQRAQYTGKTANRSPSQQMQIDGGGTLPREPDLFRVDPADDGVVAGTNEKKERRDQASLSPSQLPSYLDLPQGYSAVGESLPQELEVGHFTALNTDRYLYYSFFMRIEDLIRYEWESQVKRSIMTTPRGVFQAQLSDQWNSVIEVQLRPNGEFHKALLLKSSNIPGFDYAAIDSFAKAKLFPNPPRDMIEDDGLIHLKYSFTVRYKPQAMVTR